MPLIDPETPDDGFTYLDEATASFLQAIKAHYTRDVAVDVMDALTPLLGKDWKGRVILGIVANKYPSMRRIRILRDPLLMEKKINAIKAVRAISGLGLTEAKNLVESAVLQSREFPVRDYDKSDSYHSFESREGWDRFIKESITDLRAAGYRVEVL